MRARFAVVFNRDFSVGIANQAWRERRHDGAAMACSKPVSAIALHSEIAGSGNFVDHQGRVAAIQQQNLLWPAVRFHDLITENKAARRDFDSGQIERAGASCGR